MSVLKSSAMEEKFYSTPHLIVSDVISWDVWRIPGDIKRVSGDICQ